MKSKTLNEYLDKQEKWLKEIETLQYIAQECGLHEDFKWGTPCFTYNGKNIALIGAFKERITLSFVKGVLLDNSDGHLVAPGENSNSVRIINFTQVDQILKLKDFIKAKLFEAIEVEKAGLKIEKPKSENESIPEELKAMFKDAADFEKAFNSLTSGRQRAYLMFFNAAKQSATKINRIEKYKSRILNGKGMNDCVCGISKRMPNCDGSHKQLEK